MRFRGATVIALVFVASAANAGPDRSALRQRCGGDYATYCGDLPPGGPEVQACFRKNIGNLSPACRAEIERHGKSGRKG